MTIPIGARVHISDRYYSGVAIVLEYSKFLDSIHSEPYYMHLLGLCDHENCELFSDDCMGEKCRGWYALAEEGALP